MLRPRGRLLLHLKLVVGNSPFLNAQLHVGLSNLISKKPVPRVILLQLFRNFTPLLVQPNLSLQSLRVVQQSSTRRGRPDSTGSTPIHLPRRDQHQYAQASMSDRSCVPARHNTQADRRLAGAIDHANCRPLRGHPARASSCGRPGPSQASAGTANARDRPGRLQAYAGSTSSRLHAR